MIADDILSADVSAAGVSSGIAKSAGSFQYLKDALGTVTDIAKNSGVKVQHMVYSAFGTLIAIQDGYGADISTSPELNTSYTYTGREYDQESGLYYYRARYYDSNTGRFLQQDPKPGSLSLPLTIINSYIYVGNDPINVLDPTGMSWWTDWGRQWAINLGMALAFIGITVLSGGTALLLPALKAIAAATLGSAVIAGVRTAIYGGKFMDNFSTSLRMSYGLLLGGAILSRSAKFHSALV